MRSRYQGSLLGLGWSYVRPAVNFAVYFFVVGIFLKMSKAIPGYPVFLFSGMVVISFFTETLITSTWSVIGNAPLVQKIYLPREMFPALLMLLAAPFIELPSGDRVVSWDFLLQDVMGTLGWRPDLLTRLESTYPAGLLV